ncbi:MAG: 3-deoxy-D-manno-octulosonic-acid transferase [Candidatus Midichloriaceae bacterium]|jgi:3-deoxy-D-manno-octulosonic-acid transferase
MKIYRILTIIFFPIVILYMLFRIGRGKENTKSFLQKLTIKQGERPNKKVIWFHAASVGEVNVLIPIIKKVIEKQDNIHCVVTTATITSSIIFLKKKIKNTTHQFLPIDLQFIIRRFLQNWRPELIVFVESELWPNLIDTAYKNIPILLFNGRLSDKSFKKWKLCSNFASQTLKKFHKIYPASKSDYEKFKFFHEKNLEYIGHFKYFLPALKFSQKYVDKLNLVLKDKKILVAASTHQGEEKAIYDAHISLKKKFPNIVTIIIPRHPNRKDKIISEIRDAKLKYIDCIDDYDDSTDIFLVCEFGVLGDYFKTSDVVFLGGSLSNIGGHNIIEPAKLGATIIVGPYISNFKDTIKEFEDHDAIITVKDSEELTYELNQLFQDKERREFLGNNAYKLSNRYTDAFAKVIDLIYEHIKK